MNQRKKIYKIGLSMLIALFMLVPTGIAMDREAEARDKTQTQLMEPYIGDGGPIDQALGDVGILSLDSINPGTFSTIPEDCYEIEITIFNEGPGPALVKAFTDVYEKTEGEDVLMYETSFEDNFDIYNNWIQVDADSGVMGGFYDSWDWTDARASDGDHSMKSTMYDIYKGNQDDYLQCTKSFDVSDQDAINVSFDIWVDGQGGNPWGYTQTRYTVADYLEFQIGDQFGFPPWGNPDETPMQFVDYEYWYLLYGDYYFFDTSIQRYNYPDVMDYTVMTHDLGGGWWHVWCEVSVADLAYYYGLDVTDIMFRFGWHTDPEFQYEGAYVDNFKVISIESTETKVFQTHSQGPFEVPEGLSQFTFPLEWCAEGDDTKERCYDIKLWLEVLDLDHTSVSDWGMEGMLDVYVCVGDWFDADVIDLEIETSFGGNLIIPGDGIMTQGEDAHITAWVHFDGTIPAEDIPVTLNIYPKYWETVYETDCENMIGWQNTGNDAHVTDKDSWSGDKSFGFFNEDTFEYDFDEFSYTYGPKIDFDVEELYMDYYWKAVTEAATDDFLAPGFQAPFFNFVLGRSYSLHPAHPTACGGFSPEWIGPMQPMSQYQTVDLLDMYDWYSGYLKDAGGHPVYDLNCGFFFTTDDDLINTHPSAAANEIYWSGAFVDDISFRALKLGDPVFTDTVIIPGPIDACDVIEVQFEWEDVPYSNYKIEITCEPDGACNNLEDEGMSAQILVVSDLEMAHPKEVESIDYSDDGEGEWGISSSDYDNYLASNYDYIHYPDYANAVAILCPGGDDIPDDCPEAIDLGPSIPSTLDMTFDVWWDIEMGFDFVVIEVANCPADQCTDWYQVVVDPLNSGYYEEWRLWGSTNDWYQAGAGDFAYFYPGIDMATGGPDDDGWVNGMTVDLLNAFDFEGGTMAPFVPGQFMVVRFRIESDAGWNQRGIKIDDLSIPGLDAELNNGFGTDVDTGVFVEEFDNMDNWCTDIMHYGQFWEYIGDGEWCATFPDCGGIIDGLIWETEIMDAYEAYLSYQTMYHLDPTAEAWVQISADGGATWYTLAYYTGDEGTYFTEHFDITAWAGNAVLIRFLYENHGSAGYFCIDDLQITGKKDTTPPTSDITMTGTMKDSGWYATAVSITLTADDEGSGVKEIHYVLDGVETVIAGDTATFTVSGDGVHNIEFWAVDFTGNEGTHTTVPTFRIDSGSPPTVAITAPEPGLYLFGNKLLSASKVIIIGAFTIEATASDAESGIYRVQFYLDGDILSEDTEGPFSAYCADKHMGAGTIKVVAEDFAQNTAEDTLDITYYKFL